MENIISISEARKILPQLLKEIQKEPDTIFKISVRKDINYQKAGYLLKQSIH